MDIQQFKVSNMRKYIAKRLIVLAFRIMIRVLKIFKVKEGNITGDINGVVYKMNFKKETPEQISN